MKKKRLLDSVIDTLPKRKGFAPWYETLPADIKAEVDDIKAAWKAGKLQASKTGLSASISKALAEHGIKIGHLGVTRWLEKA